MAQINFSLSGGLAPAQLHELHRAVLRVLSDIGIACAHQPTVNAVTTEAGISCDNGRLKFAPDTVEAALAEIRKGGAAGAPDKRITVTGPYNCFNVIDLATDQVRGSTAADVVPMLKLVAARCGGGPAPVYPCDLDPRIQVLWMEKACLEHTAGMGGSVPSHDPEVIRWLGRLYAAVGKRYCLGLNFVISPLKLDHIALDLLWQFKDQPELGVYGDMYPIPVGGMTAPLGAAGLLAQTVAESLGGWIVAQRLGVILPNQPLPVRVDYGDMRYMTVGYSMPENIMVQVLARDVAQYFGGGPLDSIYINTNAKRPDAFAAVDRASQMLMLALAGFRNFYAGAGQMSMDEIFSPAQFIIDLEIGRFVQHIIDGLPWSGDAESITQTIAEGVEEKNFMMNSTTLEALPSLFDSRLFRRDNVGQWRAAGEPTIEQRALVQAREAIDSYDFALKPEVQEKLDSTFREACRALGVSIE